MKSFCQSIRFSFFVAILLLEASTGGSVAQEGSAKDPTVIDYCFHDTIFAPDGIVLKLGGEYIRVCSQWSGETGQRQVLLVINPETIEGLNYDTSALVIRLDDRHIGNVYPTLEDQIAHVAARATRAPNRVFGGYEYEAYFSELVGGNGLPGIGKYFYRRELNPRKPVLPSHSVNCIGEAHMPEGTVSCRVKVLFPKFRAAKLFIGGQALGTIPIDRFPDTAIDIARIINSAIVTDQIKEISNFLDVIE